MREDIIEQEGNRLGRGVDHSPGSVRTGRNYDSTCNYHRTDNGSTDVCSGDDEARR